MGNKQAVFTQEQLDCYQDCTYFTANEILRLFKRFRQLHPDLIPKLMSDSQCRELLLPSRLIEQMPEFKDNPFADRVIQVFAGSSSGLMNFESFLNMFSVLSDHAPREVKAFYAFKIYDADDDQQISVDDLEWTLQRLTRQKLTNDEVSLVVNKVLEEAEMDDDMQISFMEFEHVMSRAPDFLSTFHIRI